MEILWEGKVSAQFRAIRPKLCRNRAFLHIFHTRKLDETRYFMQCVKQRHVLCIACALEPDFSFRKVLPYSRRLTGGTSIIIIFSITDHNEDFKTLPLWLINCCVCRAAYSVKQYSLTMLKLSRAIKN